MSQPLGALLARRLGHLLARAGQSVTVTRGVDTIAVFTARISPLSPSARSTFFRTAETSGWAYPAFVVTGAGDAGAGVQEGDALILPNGLTYTVRRVDRPRFGGVVVKTVLYVARNSA